MIIDLHHHLVYGVDDGAQTFEDSIEMLKIAHEQGIDEIVCSSHFIPGYRHFDLDVYTAHLNALQDYADEHNYNVRLVPGAEILYTECTPEYLMSKRLPRIGNSNALLFEFLPTVSFDTLKQAASEVGYRGYDVVFAHVERYSCLCSPDDKSLNRLRELHDDYGVYTQINASTVISGFGLFGSSWVNKAFKKDLIDIVASDSHNSGSRKCQLAKAMKIVEKKLGSDKAVELFYNTPYSVIHEQNN